jgi:hypothetical protein
MLLKKPDFNSRHDCDVSPLQEEPVLVASVWHKLPRDLLVVRGAKHVTNLVGRHYALTVLAHPAKGAAVLVAVDVCDAARAAAGTGEDEQGQVGSVEGRLFAAWNYRNWTPQNGNNRNATNT